MGKNKFLIANWKMNQNLKEIEAFFQYLGQHFSSSHSSHSSNSSSSHWAGIAPQALHLGTCLSNLKKYHLPLYIGAQNCGHENAGAFTGEISPAGLKELGVNFTLVGHSERRTHFKETSSMLAAKVKKALENQLTVVFCLGETLEAYEKGETFAVIQQQIREGLGPVFAASNAAAASSPVLILAYEPVWAIGTGKTPRPEEVEKVHQLIASELRQHFALEVPILYGGSVNTQSMKEFSQIESVAGYLVGGASLNPQSFCQLYQGL